MRKEKGFEAGAFSTSERMIETIREILENEELDDFFCIEEILDLYHNTAPRWFSWSAALAVRRGRQWTPEFFVCRPLF